MISNTPHETTMPATHATIHFWGYRPGQADTYVFSVAAGDADGRLIHGEACLPRWRALQDAINIITAATLDGLTKEERAKLRELARCAPSIRQPPA